MLEIAIPTLGLAIGVLVGYQLRRQPITPIQVVAHIEATAEQAALAALKQGDPEEAANILKDTKSFIRRLYIHE